MGLEKEVREFIVDNFLFGAKDVELGGNDSFIEMGIVDSTGVLEIVNFLESRYKIVILDDELAPTNLDSVQKIVRYVQAKLAGNR